jgi:hypothetical protein
MKEGGKKKERKGKKVSERERERRQKSSQYSYMLLKNTRSRMFYTDKCLTLLPLMFQCITTHRQLL